MDLHIMNILYVTQYFPPEVCAPAARVSELARHWVKAGQGVTVLTGFPNHPTGIVPPAYRSKLRRLICREKFDGADVVRTWLMPLPNRKSYERILNYASFCLSSSFTGSFLRRPDVVVATSPQLMVGLTGWWLGRIKRIPFILEVRDLWPESLAAVGVGGETSLLYRSLSAISGFLYRVSDHIVVVSPAFKEELIGKWRVRPEKISVVENGVETDLFTPDGPVEAVIEEFDLRGKFVIAYVGTQGNAHGLDTLLEAAVVLQKTVPDALFLLVGEGAEKARLIARAEEMKLTNVRFVSQQPREKIPGIIRASHLCLVMLKKADVFKTVIPTKMLEFMSCGRPLLLGVDGQARQIVDEARAGVFIEPENSSALVGAVTELHRDAARREALGRNGRRYIVENLSREGTAKKYLGILEEVVRSFGREEISLLETARGNTGGAN